MSTKWNAVPRDPLTDDDELELLYQVELQASTAADKVLQPRSASESITEQSQPRQKPPHTVADNYQVSKLA
jgi:hypothetical protein